MSTFRSRDPHTQPAAPAPPPDASDDGARRPEFVVALARGLRVLEAFSASTPAMGLTELARRAGLSKRATYRLASTLEARGYLVQDPERKTYRPSLRVLDLGFTVLESLDFREKARPFINALAQELREFVSLAVLDGTDIVFVDTVKPPSITVGVQTYTGYRLPAHCTSHGKVMLAYLPAEQLDALVDQMTFDRRTPKTITNPAALKEDLAWVRQRGFAVNEEESSLGLRSAAAPIRARDGQVVATINLAIPTVRASREYLESVLAQRVVATASQVSAALGYR